VSGTNPRILIVDDDVELSSLMTEFLAEQGFDCKAAHNGPDGLRAALAGAFDLVLLDVMMPGFDGFEVLRRLREQNEVPVLMLTARTESQSRILGLESGADDYLPKPFEPLELAARIRAILRRSRPSTSIDGAVEIGPLRLDANARRLFHRGDEIEITSVEFDILELLMRSAGTVVSRDDLMQRLYQRPATPFDRSIDVHISHLRKKLEPAGDPIRTVRGVGYQFAGQQER
jgi:two-component system response regulator CpxR